jgi:hypothetical protein
VVNLVFLSIDCTTALHRSVVWSVKEVVVVEEVEEEVLV